MIVCFYFTVGNVVPEPFFEDFQDQAFEETPFFFAELSTHLLTAQHEIETLRTQLRKADATIRGYMRMVEGQASDLYASDTDTWIATSSV
jgi:hypothetical protein